MQNESRRQNGNPKDRVHKIERKNRAGANPACSRSTMNKDTREYLSSVAGHLKRSEIRELLKVTRQPDMISFAGGLPSPDTLPIGQIQDISTEVLARKGTLALQYGPTEGEPELRQELAEWMSRERPGTTADNIQVTCGAQQALDIIGKLFIDPGDIVVMELPSYVGALQTFSSYRVRMLGVPQDDQGMRMDRLEDLLKGLDDRGERAKFIYVIPDYQNPSGATMPLDRRRHLLELARRFDVPVIEDSPYRELRFNGEPLPSLYGLDNDDRVIVLKTFSKILGPGLRVGWITASQGWLDRMVMAKQGMDLCCPTFVQLVASAFMSRGLLPGQIEHVRKLYHAKRDLMTACLEKRMPPGVTWTKPEGGLFLWVKTPSQVDTERMIAEAVARKVIYVVGTAFHCDGGGRNAMRLNYSYSSPEDIEKGVGRLAETIRKLL